MAKVKISELTAMGAVDVSANDSFAIVDVSEDVTNKITYTELKSKFSGATNSFSENSYAVGVSNTVSGASSLASGSQNTVSGASSLASGSQNNVSGSGSLASGISNVVNGNTSLASGTSNSVYSDYSIAGGRSNNLNLSTHSFAFGKDNSVQSSQEAFAVGLNNRIESGSHRSIATGRDSRTFLRGQRSHAIDSFTNIGDAQYTDVTLKALTTDATPTELSIDASADSFLVEQDTAMFLTVAVTGFTEDGVDAAHYIRKVAIKNEGGTTSLIGSVSTIGTDVETQAGYDVSLTADDTNDTLAITVTGDASKNMRWVAYCHGTLIGMP